MLSDWNGTLFNDLPVVYGSIKEIFKTYDLKAPSLATYQAEISSDYMNSFYWKYGIPKTVTADILNRIRQRYFEERWERSKLFPHVRETVSHLKKRGVPTHIITAEDMEIMFRRADELQLAKVFDYIVPDARDKGEAMKVLAHQCRVDLTTSVYVDDSADGLRAAKRLGVTTIGAVYGYQPAWRIREAQPDFVAENFADVAKILLSEARISA